ncbi:hypothetical protein N7510_005326 [Penicillium lagena]|uniref:uncharacterized protein n=1 Tax=Penicillium lagena TaxID=94218 RepID=UPI00254059B6|nr:uncharacterized protein N7510_005326 [Penicillium lagena]KAJ5612132.1 hypothetical protein N7510_005326 [Penicillium lagena]
MQSFKIDLPHSQFSGRFSVPKNRSSSKFVPLLVCIHGGGYDSEYFDASPEYSITAVTKALGIPVVAIDRPGYGDSDPFQPPIPSDGPRKDDTFAHQQGLYLNSYVLPAVWQEFGEKSGATAVVLLAHSIGAMMAISAAGQDSGRYPLAGLITSGIGAELNLEISARFLSLLGSTEQTHAKFNTVIRDAAMLQLPAMKVTDPQVAQFSERLNKPTPIQEMIEINTTWLDSWHRYSHAIKVPVMYGISEFDELWLSTQEAVHKYRDAFPASPRVECGIVPMAPHCIELSLQSRGWLARCCGFAMECAGWDYLNNRGRVPTSE